MTDCLRTRSSKGQALGCGVGALATYGCWDVKKNVHVEVEAWFQGTLGLVDGSKPQGWYKGTSGLVVRLLEVWLQVWTKALVARTPPKWGLEQGRL